MPRGSPYTEKEMEDNLMRFVLTFILFSLLTLSVEASSSPNGSVCFNFEVTQPRPDATSNQFVNYRIRTWCYASKAEGLFVYQLGEAQDGILVQTDRRGDVEAISFFVSSRGKKQAVYLKKNHEDLWGVPIPLTIAQAFEVGQVLYFTPRSSTKGYVEALKKAPKVTPDFALSQSSIMRDDWNEIEEPDDLIPYGTYWWPQYNVPMANGDDSPLGQVRSVYGSARLRCRCPRLGDGKSQR